MPRQPRLDLPCIPQHVIQRGNDRKPCFFCDDDRSRYLAHLELALIRNYILQQRALGSPRFLAAIEALLGRCASVRPARRPTVWNWISNGCKWL